jgi:hypothetical protein
MTEEVPTRLRGWGLFLIAASVSACGARTELDLLFGRPGAAPDGGSQDDGGIRDAAAPDASDAAAFDGPVLGPDAEPSCTSVCTLGDSQCEGSAVGMCVRQANGCTAWGNAMACGANQSCAEVQGGEDVPARAECACNPGRVFVNGACLLSDDALAPRAIAPLSTSTVTSHAPVFRWALADGDDGAFVDICRDRACRIPSFSFYASGASGAPPGALTAGAYYWRLHGTKNGAIGTQMSPVWEFFVGARSAPVNSSWGTTLDANGDGFADIVVGANGAGADGAGAAYLYYGGANGVSTTPTVISAPAGAPRAFGASVASAGDVNGDGFGDVIVGSAGGYPFTGSAYAYLGGPNGLSTTPEALASPVSGLAYFGAAVASAGDVNGDGFAGYTRAAYVYSGGPSGLSTTPTTTLAGPDADGYFGASVAGVGDLNGDGFADVIVGGFYENNFTGAAYVYLGGPSGLSTTPVMVLTGPLIPNEYFGTPVASAGDVNGDGYADVIVGTTGDVSYAGAVDIYVYFGGAGGLSPTPAVLSAPNFAPGAAFESFSVTMASPGDVNGDGFSDVVIGAYYDNDNTGSAYIYFGGANGLSTTPSILTGPAGTGGEFGTAVASTGDVDGDGFADVLVGAIDVNGSAGAAYVYGGAAGGPSTMPTTLTGPGTAADYFGGSLASARHPGGRPRFLRRRPLR